MLELVQVPGLPKLRKLIIYGERFQGASDNRRYCPLNLFTGAVSLKELYSLYTDFLDDSTLQAMSFLEEFVWSSNFCSIDPESPTILLPSRHIFYVERYDCQDTDEDEDGSPHLPMIRVPNLTKLKIKDNINEFNSLLSIIRNSKCVIKYLKLSSISVRFMVQITRELHDV
ncbi:hypothetical protein BDQ17DRAFT_1427947 [Cyathus striatus]|nr:hypothetical protein BDQ17DRAFT_1427947 [Cyathus striatus]